MSPEELKARARRVVEEILNQGDLAVANELISPGCVHHIPGPQPAPGLAGLIGWLAVTQRIFPDFHAIVEDEIAEGDQVVQRITCYGTHQGEFCGVRPTGEQVAFPSIEINRAGTDGKFTEHWSSADLLGVLHRLDVVPALAGHTPGRSRHAPDPADHIPGRPHLPEGDSDGFIRPHA